MTSVRVADADVEDACVTLDVKVKNLHSGPIGGAYGVGGDKDWPNPFIFTYKRRTLWNAVSSIVIDGEGSIPPGGTANGKIRTCFERIEPFHDVKPGDRLTIHLEEKRWRITLPKPKPEPDPTYDLGDDDPSGDGSSGGGSGYTGPRCYAPGGKTWRPC